MKCLPKLLGSLLLTFCFVGKIFADDSLIVETTNGPIEGYTMTWKDGSVVKAWQGIPYGKPPVGDLRWRSPQVPTP